jgi:predicted ATPase/transcriptional regulator with XRE-family HTH domain/Tfp pilus assembly protein PilF
MAIESITPGTWLKQRRKEFDLTQEELARQVGCSAIAIRKIEADEYRPSKQIALKLAESLEVPTGEWELFVKFARGETLSTRSSDIDREAPWRGLHHHATEINVPVPLTRLIGREQDVEEVSGFLLRRVPSGCCRLVTLTGPPGVGKTRLGIEVAARLPDRFPDGIFFVPLASMGDPNLVMSAIATALSVKEAGEKTLIASLRSYLRGKHLLLVLDNFEQVVEAAPHLEDLLGACVDLAMLVTSREALHIQGEQQYQVAPLPLPDPPSSVRSANKIRNQMVNPAVTLFVERARSVKPSFELTEENAASVVAICARLDGLPLAIEIAAARVKLLSCQAILARLESTGLPLGRLSLPQVASRHAANTRRQTLRGAIDWSYNLLDRPEARLFARLGVFTGGYTPAAVEAVCNARGDLEIDVLDGIESLLDKSLLRHEEGEGEEDRFTMLETIREYALETLLSTEPDAEAISRHHAEYYLALAEAAESELRGTRQAVWLDRLERDHANLRTTLRWSEKHDTNVAVRLAATLWWFWWLRGYLSEGRTWLREILSLERGANEDIIWRARGLRGAGWLAYAQGDYAAARTLFEQGLTLFEESGEKRGIAHSLDNLGAVAFALSDNDSARALYERGLAIRRELGDRRATATSLNNLGLVATAQGDYVPARQLLEESQALYRELADAYGIATSLNNLALSMIREGKREAALPVLKEGLSIRAAMGDKYAIAYSLVGFAAYASGATNGVEGASTAVRLLAASHTLLETIGARLENAYLEESTSTLARARSLLGEAGYSQAWEAGASIGMEQAIAEASLLE